MNQNQNNNGSYSVKKREPVFVEGQSVQSVDLLLQGKVDVYLSPVENLTGLNPGDILQKSYRLFSIDQNIFIGVNDLLAAKKHSFSYLASEDANLYAFPAQNAEHLENLTRSQKDYAAYITVSLASLIKNSFAAVQKLEHLVRSMEILTENLTVYFWLLKEKIGFGTTPASGFFREGPDKLQLLRDKNITLPLGFDASFFEKDLSEALETEYAVLESMNLSRIEYFTRLLNMPLEVKKNFFSADDFITAYHCTEASQCLAEIQNSLKSLFTAAEQAMKKLYSIEGECLFSEYAKAAEDAAMHASDTYMLMKAFDFIVDTIKKAASAYAEEYAYRLEIHPDYIDNLYHHVKAVEANSALNTAGGAMEPGGGTDFIPEELRDSAEKILAYADIPEERKTLFIHNLEVFRCLKDKLSTDPDVRSIRSAISSVFYEIYEAVFKRVLAENSRLPLHHMFLTYGYMDERLLQAEQINTLYKLVNKPLTHGKCPVYNMRDWLVKIYRQEKDPSVNEFGQDYFDVFREMKKRGEITEKEKPEYDNNTGRRLSFEISHMFKTNHKVCNGQISVFFPILHRDMIGKDLSKALLTPEMINESINKILEVDFSAFHREISYRDAERGIEKEFIKKAVCPDILLMPTFGTRAFMWQELTGRNRNSPARFVLPMFTSENPEDFILKLMGNFRWELCRTMMGVAWNDITEKSLTSEYTDYVQFYKKNKDLTEEAKERLKAQIQKYNNKLRDIFTADYETWIHYESKGIIRLNKVVRGILYRNCPLSRSLREQLERQPLFSDIAVRFRNVQAKQLRTLENHYNTKYIRAGIPLDPELEENLKFFREF